MHQFLAAGSMLPWHVCSLISREWNGSVLMNTAHHTKAQLQRRITGNVQVTTNLWPPLCPLVLVDTICFYLKYSQLLKRLISGLIKCWCFWWVKKNTGYIKGLVMSSEYQAVLTFSSGALKAYKTSGARINCWDISLSLHFHREISAH